MKKLNSKINTKFISEPGTKNHNKDYFGFVELDNFACWAIAESYDHDMDITSAKLAVETVLNLFTQKPTLSKGKLKSYIEEAHYQLKAQSVKFHLKASIMIVATDYKNIRYAHCGNCRLHIFRGVNIFHKSHDQSLYQDMVNKEEVPEDSEKGLLESRNLFDYLGKSNKIKINISKKITLLDEDVLLMTTWGLWEKITTVEMLDALEGVKGPQEYIDELQDLFLSKQEKVVNNYTLATIFVNKTFQAKDNKKKIIRIIIIVTVILLFIGIILFIYLRTTNKKRIESLETISEFEKKGDIYIEDENYDRAIIEFDSGIIEVKKLKQKTGKKGIENKEISDRLSVKQRVTQLIIDGDTLFESGKYENAKQSYQKALKEAKTDMDFYDNLDIKDIENKLTRCDDFKYTEEIMELALKQADLEQYDNALISYREARLLAVSSKNATAEKDIKLKIDEIESKIKAQKQDEDSEIQAETAQEKTDNITKIDGVVLKADMALAEKDYEQAQQYYNDAIGKYSELGEMEKASEVQQKLIDLNKQLKTEEDSIQIEIAMGYTKTGDNFMISNNYDDAIISYKSAKDLYVSLKKPEDIVILNDKIANAESKNKEVEISNVILEIDVIELEGDKLLKKEDYEGAKEKYRQARTLYQGINQTEKVLNLQEKIKSIEDIQLSINKDGDSQNIYIASLNEIKAEEEIKKKNYETAIEFLIEAKELYIKLGEYESALKVEKRIEEVEKLMKN